MWWPLHGYLPECRDVSGISNKWNFSLDTPGFYPSTLLLVIHHKDSAMSQGLNLAILLQRQSKPICKQVATAVFK